LFRAPGAPGRFSPWGELPLVAAQPGEVAPLALGGSAGAALTDRDGRLLDLRRGRRGLVDHRLGGDRSADALAQRPLDDDGALLRPAGHDHPGADADERRGLGTVTVDADVPAAAGGLGLAAGLEDPHRPQPAVHAHGVLGHGPMLRGPGAGYMARATLRRSAQAPSTTRTTAIAASTPSWGAM